MRHEVARTVVCYGYIINEPAVPSAESIGTSATGNGRVGSCQDNAPHPIGCGNDCEVVSVTASVKAVGGLDWMTRPSSLILSGTTLYGDTSSGGLFGSGTIFWLNTDGTGFTNLYNFSTAIGAYYVTNADGASPQFGLILSGNTLYGTALFGGLWGVMRCGPNGP
jgi:hypothetical protein